MDINNINEFATTIRKDIEKYEYRNRMLDTCKYNSGFDKDDLKEMNQDINNNKQELELMIRKYLQNLNLKNV